MLLLLIAGLSGTLSVIEMLDNATVRDAAF